ncbi:MAG: GAF domain-containing protein [Pseudomonadota bacterium]
MSIDEAARVVEDGSSQDRASARVPDAEVLYRLADAIGRAASLDETLDEALSALTAALGLSRVAVLLADDAGVLQFVAWRGLSDAYRELAAAHAPWPADVQDPQPVLVADIDEEPELAPLRGQVVGEGIRALAFVPLVHRGRLLGTFMLYRAEPGPWSEREVRLTQAIATHIAAAAERHRAFSALAESHRRLDVVLRDVADGITVQGPDGRLQYANDAAARTLGFASADALLAASLEEVVATFELFDENRRPLDVADLPGRRALAGEVTAEQLLLYRVRATGEERWSLVRATPVHGEDGRVEAAINVIHDITERRRAEERLRFVSEAGVALASSLDVESTLAQVARLAVPRIADWCIVYLRDDDGAIRRVAIEHAGGDGADVGRVLDRYPLDAEARVGVPSVIREGRSLLLPDLTTEGLMADVVDPEGLARELRHVPLSSYLCVPLTARGRTLGAIALLVGDSGRTFDDGDLELAEQLASRAALSVDNARLLRVAEDAAARERRRGEQLLRLSRASLVVNSFSGLDETLAVLTAQARETVGAVRAVTTLDAPGVAAVKAVAGDEADGADGPTVTARLVGRDGTQLGILELVGAAGSAFTPEDEAILVQLAQMASVAIENSRLLDERAGTLALLDTLVQTAPIGVAFFDRDLRFVRINETLATINGLPRDAHVGRRPTEVREGFEPVEELVRRVLETGEPILDVEVAGEERAFVASYYPVRAASGLLGVGAIVVEVTEARRAEERLRLLAEASTALASSLDLEETLATISHTVVPAIADWCAISVLEDDGTVRVVAWTHSDPERQRWADEMRARRTIRLDDETPTAWVLRSGEPVLFPVVDEELLTTVQPEDRELARVMGVRSLMAVPFTSGAGTLGSIMFVSSESGRRFGDDDLLLARELGRRAGVAIENARLYRAMEGRARAAEALEFVADGVVTVDREGIVRLWNPAAAATLRRPAAEAVGRRMDDVVPGWVAVSHLIPVVPAEEGQVPRPETVPLDAGAREAWVSISGVAFAEGTVYAFRDLTEERGLERMKSDFVSTVSHELRTPLAAIYGAALTLRRAEIPLTPEQRDELLDVIADEADRLARIVNDILWTSRIESGVIQVQIESCDARGLARAVVQTARVHLPASHELTLEVPDDLPRVAADPDKVRQVLSNLLDNAVKYSPAGGRVAVRLEADHRVVRFVVEDDGLGIPAGDRDRVFEKFYRLDPDLNRGVGGTGLGLYICRELVRRMDGWIWVEERSGGGSRFVVELPALV